MVLRPFSRHPVLQASYIIVFIIVTSIQMTFSKKSPLNKNFTADSPNVGVGCHNFTVGNREKQELFSPGYPNTYPHTISCTTVIEAPFPDLVQLDFRNIFEIEPSETCEYDGLVVRDGRFGFSKILAQHCGEDYPPIITSSGRWLWLKFYSDETLAYKGFHAVYKFVNQTAIRPQIEECVFNVTGYAGEIRKKDIPIKFLNYTKNWNIPLKCIWRIKVKPNWKVYISFKEFALVDPNACDENFIDIHGSKLLSDISVATFCSTLSEPRRVEENIAHVTFYAEPLLLDANFHIIWTAYRTTNKKDKCKWDEFLCHEDTCIDKSLTCDGNDNCEQQNDEDEKEQCRVVDKYAMLRKEHMVGILVLACGMITGICISTMVRCRRKIRDHKKEMARLRERRSKESSIAGNLDSIIDPIELSRRKSERMRKSTDNMNSEDCHVPVVGGIALNVIGNKHPNGGRCISRDGGPGEVILETGDDIHKNPNELYNYDHLHNRCDHPPPPPPPPPARFRDWTSQYNGANQCAIHSNRTSDTYKTAYGMHTPPTPDDSEIDNDSIPPAPPPPTSRPPKSTRPTSSTPSRSPQRFRAEAVIELAQQEQRPRSFESTKSAPDVIVTH